MYIVGEAQWEVGERYELVRKLGGGSYGEVCLAWDTELEAHVALKKVPNVLQSHEYAKRVLREVCILRRVRHPNIIALLDAFLKDSSAGPFSFIGGRLRSTAMDLYLAMEFAEGGDLFEMRGQLTETEVAQLLRQLLNAVSFLHSHHIFHRDLKTANLILGRHSRVVKLCDFGLARLVNDQFSDDSGADASCMEEAESDTPRQLYKEGFTPFTQHVPGPHGYGLHAPLTGKVCTPSYRAPEVVMGQDCGDYSAAIDMWAVGCILGELLQRQMVSAGGITPKLQVQPLFHLTGAVKTPTLTEDPFTSNSNKNKLVRAELHAIFDVIGTPSWASINMLPGRNWSHYLQKLPGTPSSLHHRFHGCSLEAVDLLHRMLTFNPKERCTAEEALAHVYFKCLQNPKEVDIPWQSHTSMSVELEPAHKDLVKEKAMSAIEGNDLAEEAMLPLKGTENFWEVQDATLALRILENELEQLATHSDSGKGSLRTFLEKECQSIADWRAGHPNMLSDLHAEEQRILALNEALGNVSTQQSADSFMKLFHDQPPIEQSLLFDSQRQLFMAGLNEQHLKPEFHLQRKRHGDWTTSTGRDVKKLDGDVWGVSTVPSCVKRANTIQQQLYADCAAKQAGR